MTTRIHAVAAMLALSGMCLGDIDPRGPREPRKHDPEAIAAAQAKRERRKAKRRGAR